MTAQSMAALDSAALAARIILQSSGETYRAEETALRICASFGLCDAQIMAFPTGFVLSAKVDGRQESRVFRVQDRSIRLDRIDKVNAVSREVVSAGLNEERALQRLLAIHGEAPQRMWKINLSYALTAAFFSVMFGGGYREFSLCFLVGSLTHLAQTALLRLRYPSQLRSFLLGLFTALASVAGLRLIQGSQEAVITGVIMPLLPGLAMTNAVRDTMRGDLISGLARGAEALFSAVLLSAGVASALLIGGL